MYRVKHAYLDYFQKRTNFNHKKGPFHFREPAHIVKKTIRRMLPIQTARGIDAYQRVRCFDGLPEQFAKNMVVIPSCVRDIKLKPASKYCILGEVASEIGWNHFEDNKQFEQKAAAAIAEKKAANTEKYNAACNDSEVAALNEELKKFGYGY